LSVQVSSDTITEMQTEALAWISADFNNT